VGPRRRREARQYNMNVVQLLLGILVIIIVVLLMWLFGLFS
jgi:hypothetical protein